ncbi:MAG: 2-dehydropantoate 2-reductase [Clostridia bacterium]|nr:2-dehydropantoate 2-reductase [Clostridia bacterium]
MRICIYGAGAMGTSLGVLLSRVGAQYDLVSRNCEHVSALREQGGILKFANETVCSKVSALLPEEMEGEYDLIILSTKQRDNRTVAEQIKPYLSHGGAVLTVQNGLPEEGLAEVFGVDAIYGGVLSWGAEREEAGVVKLTSNSGFHIGLGAFGAGEKLGEIAELLSKVFTVTTGNLCELRFAKLATNACFSTLSTISGLPFGALAKKYRRDCMRLIREIFAVARAYGAKKLPLNGHDLFQVFSFCGGILLPVAMKHYRNTYSGMLRDLEAGRRCDIDYVAGAAVVAAQRKGVEVPYLERAVELVHDIENGLAEIAPETLKLLKI